MHHAAASSSAPAARANAPNAVPVKPRSTMILASMGNAVMHIEAPRNSIASHGWTAGVKNSPFMSTSAIAKPAPRTNGIAIPAAETKAAVRTRLEKRSDRNSTPTKNM